MDGVIDASVTDELLMVAARAMTARERRVVVPEKITISIPELKPTTRIYLNPLQ